MPNKEFEVPLLLMLEFANLVAKHDLPCELMGSTEEEEIILEIEYEPNQRKFIHKLSDLIDDYLEREEENDSEQEDEEDDE